jgi:hypothetical protein
MDKSRNPVTPSVTDHGQNPSECKKKNRITRDAGVGRDESKMTHEMLKPPQESPYSTREAQFKCSSNRNGFQAALVV